MQALKGKSVLVTGASSGIGRASAKAFVKEGMRVAVSARSTDRLLELLKELGPEAIMLPADLTNPAETDELIHQAIAKLGRLDVLFANAGVYIAGQVADGDPAEWDKLLALNVGSVFRSINRVIPHMRAHGGGDILVSSSISAYQAIHFEPVYSASKHALNAFLYGVRRQVIQDRIRIGAIAPATVLNELWGYTDPNSIDKKVAAREDLRSEDVGEAAVFMSSRPPHVAIRDLVMLPQALDISTEAALSQEKNRARPSRRGISRPGKPPSMTRTDGRRATRCR
jgi:ribitol 2-dehydrogenase